MAIDRNRLEQEAVKFLQKGKTEQAIQRYQALVRDDPRDRRIRQKLAELYIQVGRYTEGEQHLRQLVKSFVRKGQERQAVPLLKQLVKLKPDDHELKEELGDLFITTGFPDQARKIYDETLEMLERVYPDKAVPILQKIIKLAPAELPQQIKLAELYEASNWSEKACNEWQRLAGEARRLGRREDRARFLEYALRLRSDQLPVLQDAAEARRNGAQGIGLVRGGLPPDALPLSFVTDDDAGRVDEAARVVAVQARRLGHGPQHVLLLSRGRGERRNRRGISATGVGQGDRGEHQIPRHRRASGEGSRANELSKQGHGSTSLIARSSRRTEDS